MDKIEAPNADNIKPGELLIDADERFSVYVNEQFAQRTPGAKKVLIGSLTLTMVNQTAYGSHMSNFYQLGRDCPGYDFAFCSPRRLSIADMRNLVVKLAIEGDFDYLYFFDDDTVNDTNVLGRLLPHMAEFNAVSASYYIRGYPFSPMVFKWTEIQHNGKLQRVLQLYPSDDIDANIDDDGVLRRDVGGLGCGCTLFRVEDFKRVPYPWFKTGHGHTEDAWWFTNAGRIIPEYRVGMDFSISCGHLCDPLFVDHNNVKIMREFYEKLQSTGGISQ